MIKNIFLSAIILVSLGVTSAYADIIYLSTTDGHIYRKTQTGNDNGTAINTANSNTPAPSPNGQYVLYTNIDDNNRIYRKNANDTGNGTAITSDSGYFPNYSPDMQYIIYRNISQGNVLYRKNANDTGNGTAITTNTANYANYSADGQYIVYMNDSNFTYKKNANDTGNGTYIQFLSIGTSAYPTFSPDGLNIIAENVQIYKVDSTTYAQYGAINSNSSAWATYSPDGNYILYSEAGGTFILYQKNANDTGNGTAMTTVGGYYPRYITSYNPTPYCATPAPSGGNYGSLTYNPTTANQSWVWDTYGTGISCSYSCLNGYTGSGCTTPPPAPAPSPVNGACGVASGTYPYTATDWYGGSGSLCSVGTATGTLTFPSPGNTVTYTCLGSYSGSNASCYGTVQAIPNSCATPAPSGGNYGSLTYNPTTANQSWVYSTLGSSCSYTCLNGYTGSGCTTAPVSATGTGAEVGFWSSLINPITNFFADFMGFLKKILDINIRPEPYGVFFTGSTNPISLGIGAQVGCGLTTSSQSTSSYEWTGIDCVTGPLLVGGNYLSGSTWNYNWNYRQINWGVCRPTTGYVSGTVDTKTMIQSGSFTYLHDMIGNNITVANLITMSNTWSISVNWKYNVNIFGFSVIDVINSVIDLLVGAVRYVIDYIVLISKNILDLISMFFYSYQGEAPAPFIKNACYYGDILPIGDTFTETAITHTPNNGELDFFFTLAYVWWIYKRIKKKYIR